MYGERDSIIESFFKTRAIVFVVFINKFFMIVGNIFSPDENTASRACIPVVLAQMKDKIILFTSM